VVIEERFSLRTSLVILVLACVVPLMALGGVLLVRQEFQLREQTQARTQLLTRSVLAEVERELTAVEAGLSVLATAQSLQGGNFAAFHQQATAAVRGPVASNILLTDPEGRQLLNTLQPYGRPLAFNGKPAAMDAVMAGDDAVLSKLLTAPATGQPTVVLGVPVRLDGQPRYGLAAAMPAAAWSRLLARQPLPEGWLVALLDQDGLIVARSRDAERFIGQPAVPELLQAMQAQREGHLHTRTKEGIAVTTSHLRSARWGWTVAVGAPEHLLRTERTTVTLLVLAGGLLALALGLGVAWRIAGRVLATVHGLNAAARALQRGEPLHLPRVQLREAEAVAQAMQRAAVTMEQVKYLAQHDGLTGIANRMLFIELARHRLALARRQSHTLALLAIDLDGFKAVNDTDGHAAGDGVLKQAAGRLEAACREADVAARLGGDEFMVLLGSTDASNAERTGQRLIDALAQPYAGTAQPVSASVGLALFPEHGETLEALMARADEALYAAKAAGKHRLRRAGPASAASP